jgi:predicted MFS family arabinose efflux permease
VLSMLCTAPAIALFGIAQSALVIAIVGVVRSFFDTITTPSGVTAMARAAPPSLTATGQGLYGAIASTMTGIAALAGASIYSSWGAEALWYSSAASMVALTLWTASIARRANVWKPVSEDPSPA